MLRKAIKRGSVITLDDKKQCPLSTPLNVILVRIHELRQKIYWYIGDFLINATGSPGLGKGRVVS